MSYRKSVVAARRDKKAGRTGGQQFQTLPGLLTLPATSA